MSFEFTLNVTPMGKPRMTQRDRWKKRPCVIRYHEFKDAVKAQLDADPSIKDCLEDDDLSSLSWAAFLPMPKSWSKKKKEAMRGQLHRQKPDRDNIDKAILDTLLPEDSGIAGGVLTKYWDDGNGPRICIVLGGLGEEKP